MRVPLLDLSEQYRILAEPIRRELDEIMRSQNFILGPKVEEFEQAIAQYCGIEHAIGVSSGTDALLAILMTLGIGPGDAIITTPYTFFATAGCIARMGATPIFVDIDPLTFNISPVAAAEFLATGCRRNAQNQLVDAENRVVRAIVPVHLFGLCCEIDAINALAEQYEVTVIEDAAQAIGAEYPTKRSATRQAGTMSQVGCFSFYPSKNLGAAGDAGMIVCHDAQLAERLRIFRQHGMERRYFHQVIGGYFVIETINVATLQATITLLHESMKVSRVVVAGFHG